MPDVRQPLRTCDVDRSGPGWKYKPASHKTAHLGQERIVYFGPKAQEVLGPLLKPDLAAFIFSPADADRERRAAQAAARTTPHSCGNRAGTNRKAQPKRRPGARYTVESYCHAIYQACDRAFPPQGNLPRALKLIQKWEQTRSTRPLPKALATAWAVIAKWRSEHRLHPQQLRHSAGTAIRRVDFEATKIILGHRTGSMTQRYAERDASKAEEVIARLG